MKWLTVLLVQGSEHFAHDLLPLMSKVVAFDWSLFTACYFRSYNILISPSDYLNDSKKEEEEIKESIKQAITSQCQQTLIGYTDILSHWKQWWKNGDKTGDTWNIVTSAGLRRGIILIDVLAACSGSLVFEPGRFPANHCQCFVLSLLCLPTRTRIPLHNVRISCNVVT